MKKTTHTNSQHQINTQKITNPQVNIFRIKNGTSLGQSIEPNANVKLKNKINDLKKSFKTQIIRNRKPPQVKINLKNGNTKTESGIFGDNLSFSTKGLRDTFTISS
jgi:hypothetical protein